MISYVCVYIMYRIQYDDVSLVDPITRLTFFLKGVKHPHFVRPACRIEFHSILKYDKIVLKQTIDPHSCLRGLRERVAAASQEKQPGVLVLYL